MNVNAIDTFGQEIASAAMRTLIRVCPEVRRASPTQLEAACAAMRATSPAVIDQLLDDAKAAPWVANLAVTHAALAIALEGAKVIRG